MPPAPMLRSRKSLAAGFGRTDERTTDPKSLPFFAVGTLPEFWPLRLWRYTPGNGMVGLEELSIRADLAGLEGKRVG